MPSELRIVPRTGDGRPMRRDVVSLMDPYRRVVVADVEQATTADVDAAIATVRDAFERNRGRTGVERAQWLHEIARQLEDRLPVLAELLASCTGKPISSAKGEGAGAVALARATAEEIRRMTGDVVPLDAVPRGAGRWGFTRREPYGVVAAITPFNAPFYLTFVKVLPALAMGNAVILKPAPAVAPIADGLVELFEQCLPAGLVTVLYGGADTVRDLVGRPGVDAVTLTGSTAAGDAVARAAGAKPVILELGSNSPNIVLGDADLVDAAERIVPGAFAASGQQCMSPQRVIVERSVLEPFVDAFVSAARGLVVGDPLDPATDLGPVVDDRARTRIAELLRDAESRGARFALDGRHDDGLLGPSILCGVPSGARLLTEEVFGPVVVVQSADDLDHAIRLANDVGGLLQGACFTRSLRATVTAAEQIHAGAVWINEPTRFHLDVYPFGGTGTSGVGREGVRASMEALSQPKFVGIRPV